MSPPACTGLVSWEDTLCSLLSLGQTPGLTRRSGRARCSRAEASPARAPCPGWAPPDMLSMRFTKETPDSIQKERMAILTGNSPRALALWC